MSQKSLEDVINAAGNPVQLLRNSQTGPYIYPVVPPEFSNWRDEQRAWRDTCILFNQSYHMTDMYMEGPDALKVLSMLGVNSFNNFGPSKAKQFVACNYDGYVIGDVILFHLEPNRFNLVGRPSVHNWVQYHCETGGYDVKLDRDERTVARPGPIVRKAYRYQVQGPNALKVIEKVTGKTVPDVKFFNMTDFQIAGRRVRALRHGMVGPARLRVVRTVGGRRRGQGGDRRGRPGIRAAAVWRANLFEQHARVRLDPFPAASDLHGRQDEGRTGSGCRRIPTKPSRHSAAASTPTTSRTTT